jgi:hypothetical protein
VSVEGLATYEDAATAEAGSQEWRALARRWLPIARLARMEARTEFRPEEENVHIETSLDEAEARMLLGVIQSFAENRRRLQRLPPPNLTPP